MSDSSPMSSRLDARGLRVSAKRTPPNAGSGRLFGRGRFAHPRVRVESTRLHGGSASPDYGVADPVEVFLVSRW
jgi:hypothetical protein